MTGGQINPEDERLFRQSQLRSTGAAYLLWLLGGIFGLHKFYLGQPVTGIVYLFTLGVFLIGVLLDLFTLPRQVKDKNARILMYGK